MKVTIDEGLLDDCESAAVSAARKAGELILEGLNTNRADLNVAHKGRVDLVTAVDLAAEQAILTIIKSAFPAHSILAEEAGELNKVSDDQLIWLIDPLDGTTNFAHGHPHCAVSIACYRGTQGLLGVVYDAPRNELFTARPDRGAYLNGRPLSVSSETSLEKSLLATGFAYDRRERPMSYIPLFKSFMIAGQGVRRMGAAALDLAWVACGRLDGFWEANLNPWDVAAGALLVELAGGQISDYSGQELRVLQPEKLVASNRVIHDQMLAIITESSDTESTGEFANS